MFLFLLTEKSTKSWEDILASLKSGRAKILFTVNHEKMAKMNLKFYFSIRSKYQREQNKVMQLFPTLTVY